MVSGGNLVIYQHSTVNHQENYVGLCNRKQYSNLQTLDKLSKENDVKKGLHALSYFQLSQMLVKV